MKRTRKQEKEIYQQGEIVLAIDAGKKYPAKILKSLCQNGTMNYFIHYQGWNAKWDKWVEESAISKAIADKNENSNANSEKLCVESTNGQSKTDDQPVDTDGNPKQGSVHSLKRKIKDENEAAAKKRKLRQNTLKDLIEDEIDSSKIRMKLEIPFSLKKVLVSDWELVTQDPPHLMTLPKDPSRTVSAIISDFITSRKKKAEGGQGADKYSGLLDGLKIYFDKALPLMLLYRQERKQYNTLLAAQHASGNGYISKLSPSDYYGAEHLLRLFVRLPQLFVHVNISNNDLAQVQSKLSDLLKFIQKNSDIYLVMSDYHLASEVLPAINITEEKPRELSLTMEQEAQAQSPSRSNSHHDVKVEENNDDDDAIVDAIAQQMEDANKELMKNLKKI